ncbi:MAG: multicopper oxidase domain-containing protein [Nostoc sp.]|uniref:multicopper oxidase family protein n=1 Tax=Nostoc sp. TaxID=1180 RepID=UPI002FF7737B
MTRIIKRIALKLAALAGVLKRRQLRQLLKIAGSVFFVLVVVIYALRGTAQTISPSSVCAVPPAGSIVKNPPEIRNPDATHAANFTVVNIAPKQNCYVVNGNLQAPTIRVSPGNTNLVLRLNNQLPGQAKGTQDQNCQRQYPGGMAPANSTNLHFHGLSISSQCHQDEVVRTVVEPKQTFQYNINIPQGEPPGLYWYHPHVHMLSQTQVLSGLTGAIIIEGIGKYNNQAARLPERVFVLRDTDLPKYFDYQQPLKDISINSVPIKYKGGGIYDPPAIIQMKPNEQQFWRVANTAADSFFDLQVQYNSIAQPLQLVSMDGVPINANSQLLNQTKSVYHIVLAPAARAEFMIKGPQASVKDAKFLTLNYVTGAQHANNPQRTIAKIQMQAASSASASDPELSVDLSKVSGNRFSGINQSQSVKQRKLYFSETAPNVEPEQFYITVEPNQPKVYDPNFQTPDITVQEGTTEDWIVENRTSEVHTFHIHQIHFLVLNSSDATEIGMMRDTINVPAWNGNPNTPFPSVKLQMDFRGIQNGTSNGTSIAGTFVYHCHILEHEDKGMMASIQVKSAN